MAVDLAADVVKFHLSLNASDLTRSIAFYRVLFGIEPAKVRPDYAKFEVTDPPLIMSLVPVAPTAGGTLNHVGLRVLDSASLVAMQVRLEQAGYATQREEGVECCYSKQTKFWVADPDRTLWELYVLHGDADENDHGPSAEHGVAGNSTLRTQGLQLPVLNAPAASVEAPASRMVWAHLLTQPLPERIPHEAATVDEVQLHGTLNMAVERSQLLQFLREARRVLRPGGALFAHALTSDGATVERPGLPGPAALVDRVVSSADVVCLIADAGFVDVRLTKLAEKACFTVGAAELRETKVSASVPAVACCAGETVRVVYPGPLRQLVDDRGNTLERGVPVVLSSGDWQALQAAGIATSLVRLNGDAKSSNCGC